MKRYLFSFFIAFSSLILSAQDYKVVEDLDKAENSFFEGKYLYLSVLDSSITYYFSPDDSLSRGEILERMINYDTTFTDSDLGATFTYMSVFLVLQPINSVRELDFVDVKCTESLGLPIIDYSDAVFRTGNGCHLGDLYYIRGLDGRE